jgi:hypothetical protein
MLKWGAAALLLVGASASEPSPPAEGIELAQLIVREQIVVRMRGRMPAPNANALQWSEGKGPKCVPARAILGAALVSPESVDLILRDRSRIRAKLGSSCPALDYYYGFYLTPQADGMVCADRDIIRSRMGVQCEIKRFRSLEIARK